MTDNWFYGDCQKGLQDAVEILRGKDQLAPGDKDRDAISTTIENVKRITEERTILLKQEIGMAQEGVIPKSTTYNRWRKGLGWDEVDF